MKTATLKSIVRAKRGLRKLLEKARKDRGEIILTVFVPDGTGLKSVTRTPHRMITHWERQPDYMRGNPIPDYVDVRRCPVEWDIIRMLDDARDLCAKRRATA